MPAGRVFLRFRCEMNRRRLGHVVALEHAERKALERSAAVTKRVTGKRSKRANYDGGSRANSRTRGERADGVEQSVNMNDVVARRSTAHPSDERGRCCEGACAESAKKMELCFGSAVNERGKIVILASRRGDRRVDAGVSRSDCVSGE